VREKTLTRHYSRMASGVPVRVGVVLRVDPGAPRTTESGERPACAQRGHRRSHVRHAPEARRRGLARLAVDRLNLCAQRRAPSATCPYSQKRWSTKHISSACTVGRTAGKPSFSYCGTSFGTSEGFVPRRASSARRCPSADGARRPGQKRRITSQIPAGRSPGASQTRGPMEGRSQSTTTTSETSYPEPDVMPIARYPTRHLVSLVRAIQLRVGCVRLQSQWHRQWPLVRRDLTRRPVDVRGARAYPAARAGVPVTYYKIPPGHAKKMAGSGVEDHGKGPKGKRGKHD
jgi:hypothetical protein